MHEILPGFPVPLIQAALLRALERHKHVRVVCAHRNAVGGKGMLLALADLKIGVALVYDQRLCPAEGTAPGRAVPASARKLEGKFEARNGNAVRKQAMLVGDGDGHHFFIVGGYVHGPFAQAYNELLHVVHIAVILARVDVHRRHEKRLRAGIHAGREDLKDQLPIYTPHYRQFRDDHRSQACIMPEAFTYRTVVDIDDAAQGERAVQQAMLLGGMPGGRWQGLVERMKGSRIAFGALVALIGFFATVVVFFKNHFYNNFMRKRSAGR